MKNQIKRFALAAVIFLLLAGMAFARHPKLAVDLDNMDPNSNVEVIIQFKHSPTEAHHQMVRDRGGALRVSFHSIKGAVYTVPAGALEALANESEVTHISPNRPLGAKLDNTAAAVNAAVAWNSYGLTGAGISVAVIDSGISDHPDLHSPPSPPAPGPAPAPGPPRLPGLPPRPAPQRPAASSTSRALRQVQVQMTPATIMVTGSTYPASSAATAASPYAHNARANLSGSLRM